MIFYQNNKRISLSVGMVKNILYLGSLDVEDEKITPIDSLAVINSTNKWRH